MPNYSAGEMTIYQQQVRALLEEDNTREPRKAVKMDLKKDIEDAKAEGREIIIGGDFNCTVQEGGLEGNNWKSWMSNLGLKMPFLKGQVNKVQAQDPTWQGKLMEYTHPITLIS